MQWNISCCDDVERNSAKFDGGGGGGGRCFVEGLIHLWRHLVHHRIDSASVTACLSGWLQQLVRCTHLVCRRYQHHATSNTITREGGERPVQHRIRLSCIRSVVADTGGRASSRLLTHSSSVTPAAQETEKITRVAESSGHASFVSAQVAEVVAEVPRLRVSSDLRRDDGDVERA